MKVYIVSEDDGFERTIHGVYLDVEKAINKHDEISNENDYEDISYSVDDYEVEE